MKKIFILPLLLLLLFTLTACSDPVEDNDNDNDINDNDNGDMDWKTQYDIVDSSQEFYDNVNVCYQIFPISYADSTGDGLGDLMGIAENVDYLSETLGVDCVWLNPFNPSTTYHKYDVTDYYGIDPEFGTMEDFEVFIETMNNNGIHVLMDLVINHSSYEHPWFINSRRGENASKRDWYTWNTLEDRTDFPSRDGWHQYGSDYYYGSFWDQMPEFNYDNPDVRQEMHNIAEFWLEKGIDGFRIDAARHIYDLNQYPRGTNVRRESIDWFREFNHYVKSVNPDAFIVGEVWTNDSQFVAGFYEGMDSNFNFRFSTDLIDSLKSGRDQGIVENLLETHTFNAQSREDYIDSIFITNHDQERIMSEVNEDLEKAKQAAHILFTMPGISWIYYGEELGMTGEKPDPAIRQPFIWGKDDAYNTVGSPTGAQDFNHIQEWDEHNVALDGVTEQLDNDNSLLNTYINLINLKQSHSAIHNGTLQDIDAGNTRLLTYTMRDEDNTYLIIHNLSRNSVDMTYAFDYDNVYASHDFFDENNVLTLEGLSTTILNISSDEITINP